MWHNQTTLHPFGLVAIVLAGLVMLLVPRRWALVPMFIIACFVSPAQRVVVLTFDFNLLRIMLLIGWARVMFYGEHASLRIKPLDLVVLAWALSSVMIMTLQQGTIAAFINRLGFFYDAVGMYFLFRCLIRSWEDVRCVAVGMAVISIPVAFAFVGEKTTGRNLFSVFGGVPEFTEVRQGHRRCQGAYGHPILAGCFWVSVMPLVASLWSLSGTRKWLSPIGVACSMVIIITSMSSTPFVAAAIAFMLILLFPLRNFMGVGLVAGAVGLVVVHFLMASPVWHLLSRIDLVGGSTGWYRFKLIDETIRRFDEWWLLGSTDYAGWWRWGLEDVTNQYVAEAVNGGLLTLSLFLAICVIAFLGIERARRRVGLPLRDLKLGWATTTSLVLHCVMFIGVSYFGQTILVWYMTLGICGSLGPGALVLKGATKRTPSWGAPRVKRRVGAAVA